MAWVYIGFAIWCVVSVITGLIVGPMLARRFGD
jgi:hypothetical protein